ncbi:MAG: hypothetical protein AAF206_31485, partial [Bacteroidota bacterium]
MKKTFYSLFTGLMLCSLASMAQINPNGGFENAIAGDFSAADWFFGGQAYGIFFISDSLNNPADVMEGEKALKVTVFDTPPNEFDD